MLNYEWTIWHSHDLSINRHRMVMYFKNGCPCSINWASHLLPFLVPHIAGAKSTAFLSSSDSIKVIIGLDVIYISTVSFFHDSPQMVQQADTTGSEHDMHVPITYVVLTHDCLSMWLVISFVLLISVYLLIWFSCSLVNFGKSNFFAVSYLVLKFSDSNNLLSFFLLDYIIKSKHLYCFRFILSSMPWFC